jgi:hypothetical protein
MIANQDPDRMLEGAEEIAAELYRTPTPSREQIRKTRQRLYVGTLKAGKVGNIYVTTPRELRAQIGWRAPQLTKVIAG